MLNIFDDKKKYRLVQSETIKVSNPYVLFLHV